jgi:aryl-alcohol dehydrogenase-like predicted oxidoreductase
MLPTITDTIAVARIDAVQAEYSAFETLHETDGRIDTARELDIAYVAYSPLGHGWLVDDFPYKTPDDFAADDFRRTGKSAWSNLLTQRSQSDKTSQSPNSKARTSTTTRRSSRRSRLWLSARAAL